MKVKVKNFLMFLILAVESESENFLMLLILAVLRFVLSIVVESESENIEISYALGICCRK